MIRARISRPYMFEIVFITIIAILTICLVLDQLFVIHSLWTPVGFVDTWPLYDRLLKLHTGQLSLIHYLLDPHVHPHAIIFFLYLMDAKFGTGQQILPHEATIFCIVSLIVVFDILLVRSCSFPLMQKVTLGMGICASAILLSGVSEATVIPFQAVVIVSRFIYIGLFAGLAYTQFNRYNISHGILLALSSIAVSFYASGGVFGAEIILLHLVFLRRWVWLIASTLPLIVYLLLIAEFTHPSGESNELIKMAHHLDGPLVLEAALGIPAYYASALVQGWPFPISPAHTYGKTVIMAVGLLVFVVTAVWSVLTLVKALLDGVEGRDAATRRIGWAPCVLALIGIWVALSSWSASLLWIARARILGNVFTQTPHYLVLTSTRYAAFACLAYAILFVIIGLIVKTWARSGIAAALFIVIVSVAFNSVDSSHLASQRNQVDQLDLAGTALMMGLPVTSHEGSAVWPGVDHDWYWPKELIQTTAYLRSSHLAYYYGMPSLGAVYEGNRTMMAHFDTSPTTSDPSVCRISGTPDVRSAGSFLAPRRFFPVVNSGSKVIGFATALGSEFGGYVQCDAVVLDQPLYMVIR